MDIKTLRQQKGLTQKEAAAAIGLPFRTFQNYEYGIVSSSSFTGRSIIPFLESYEPYSPTRGIYTLTQLKDRIATLASRHSAQEIKAVYLFGSYARKEADAHSDIDLLLDAQLTGLAFFAFQNECEESLHKKVDLIRLDELKGKTDIFSSLIKERIVL